MKALFFTKDKNGLLGHPTYRSDMVWKLIAAKKAKILRR